MKDADLEVMIVFVSQQLPTSENAKAAMIEVLQREMVRTCMWEAHLLSNKAALHVKRIVEDADYRASRAACSGGAAGSHRTSQARGEGAHYNERGWRGLELEIKGLKRQEKST
jgi:hypothetical protein